MDHAGRIPMILGPRVVSLDLYTVNSLSARDAAAVHLVPESSFKFQYVVVLSILLSGVHAKCHNGCCKGPNTLIAERTSR